MSVYAMAWAWKQQGLTPTQKLVLMALADHSDDDGVCWPGNRLLAEKCGISERNIIRVIAGLQDLGMIAVERRAGTGDGRQSNRYHLALADIAQWQSDNLSLSGGGKVTKSGGQSDKIGKTSKEEEPSEEPSVYPPYPPQKKFPYLPDWVPADAWALFLRGRQEARASVPTWQIPLLLKQLDKLRKAGHDPGEVIEQSARAGYKDFFPVKGNATHQRNHPETAREHHARVGAYIDRLAGEAAAEILGQDAVREVESDLRPGVDPPFWN